MSLEAIAAELAASGVKHKIVTAKSATLTDNERAVLQEIANNSPSYKKLVLKFDENFIKILRDAKMFTVNEDGDTGITKKGAIALKKDYVKSAKRNSAAFKKAWNAK